MRVAVIGGGVSGIAAAHACQDFAEVTLFEANSRLGGHANTHVLLVDGRAYAVDSGFIVFNRPNYPLFSAWLDALGVATQPTEMSFGVSTDSGLEYGTSSLGALFCQRRNRVRPSFMRMLSDIVRFYRQAPAIADSDPRSLSDFLRSGHYSKAFAEHHLMPMCAALWSAASERARELPIGHVASFMTHHGMTQLRNRPQWEVVCGGSQSYVNAFRGNFNGELRTGHAVDAVRRDALGVTVATEGGSGRFDYAILACHSDEALALLDATATERAVLGAIHYQPNHAVLHSDTSVMPERRAAWSSWNVRADAEGRFEFTYWMNRLQGLDAPRPFLVTLNPARTPRDIWLECAYRHPIFTADAHAATARLGEISGSNRTFYCGAYWGWGFHEDGFRSGLEAARQLRERSQAERAKNGSKYVAEHHAH